MPTSGILPLLTGGDRRSIGQSPVAVKRVLRNPRLLPALLKCLASPDPLVRMRAADALEKLDRRRPGILTPYRAGLLRVARASDQTEVQWHMAQLLPRLDLTPRQLVEARRLLRRYQASPSAIVQTMALEALVQLARATPPGRGEALRLLTVAATSGLPAVRARARRLRRGLLSSS